MNEDNWNTGRRFLKSRVKISVRIINQRNTVIIIVVCGYRRRLTAHACTNRTISFYKYSRDRLR